MSAEKDKCVLHHCLHFACAAAATLLSLHLLISEVFISKLLGDNHTHSNGFNKVWIFVLQRNEKGNSNAKAYLTSQP